MKKQHYRMVLPLLTFWGAFFLDRCTKWLAARYLAQSDILLFPGFNLHLVYNRGISFGMLSDIASAYTWLINGLIVVLIGIFALYTVCEFKRHITVIPEMLVLAGAVSNLLDRYLYGAVIDFIDLYAGKWHWHTFNVADVCVVGGIAIILARTIKQGRY